MKITIITEQREGPDTVNKKIIWFSQSLGLLGERDKDASCYRTFIELLNAARNNVPMSSDNLAYRLNLSRGTVVHHLNKLRDAGMLRTTEGGYELRVANLEQLIQAIKRDLEKSLSNLQQVAREIDEEMGL